MPEIITCDCVPKPRVFSYGDSSPVEVADARTSIAYREYYQDSTIDILDLPYCTQIGAEAFRGSSLQEIYIPICQEIKADTFRGCSSFRGGDFSSVKTVRGGAFELQLNAPSNTNIALEFPSIETIDDYAFQNFRIDLNAGDIKLDITNVKTIGQGAFWQAGADIIFYPYYDRPQKVLYLPKCESIKYRAFATYYSIYKHVFHKVILPAIKKLYTQCFRWANFEGSTDDPASFVIGPNCTEIEGGIFSDTSSINNMDLYVYATTPPRLTSQLDGALGTSNVPKHIYVPAGSIDAYKAATYWNTSFYLSHYAPMPSDHLTIDTWLIN